MMLKTSPLFWKNGVLTTTGRVVGTGFLSVWSKLPPPTRVSVFSLLMVQAAGGAGEPIVAVGINSIVQRVREGERTERVVGLHAAADDRLLVPQQAALDVHVLKGE